jgi:hypothetical protein
MAALVGVKPTDKSTNSQAVEEYTDKRQAAVMTRATARG